MSSPPARPTLAYDGECGFCKRWVERWRIELAGRVEFESFQELAAKHPEIPLASFRRTLHLLEPDGRVLTGAHAVLQALAHDKRRRWMLWAYERVPLVRPAAERVYRAVAANRTPLSKLAGWLVGPEFTPASYAVVQRVFLALLGVVYLVAFWSFWIQADALIGKSGILP